MIEVGQKITLKADREAWYSGYGNSPQHIIKAGEIGEVTHVQVPSIWRRGVSYNIARFEGGWQVDFRPNEVASD